MSLHRALKLLGMAERCLVVYLPLEAKSSHDCNTVCVLKSAQLILAQRLVDPVAQSVSSK